MIEIRKAEESDLPLITSIYNEAILNSTATFDTEPKSLENRKIWFSEHVGLYPLIVALINEVVVGWASMSRWSERCAYDTTAEISLYITESERGKGIGNLLLKSIILQGKISGLHTVLARITEGNEVSVHLHLKNGFSRVGTMKEVGMKFGKLLDVEMLQLVY